MSAQRSGRDWVECRVDAVDFRTICAERRILKHSQDGFGLGLPLAKELVELHDSQLTAYSDGPGKGSTFTFSLPIDPDTDMLDVDLESDSPTEEKSQTGDNSQALRVLVIDDEQDLTELFVRLLERRGYAVEMASDGLKGIELARSFEPRVILLDLGLPEIDGYEVCRRLREEFGDTKPFIVAVSGYERNPPKLKAAGFDRHLLKPPDMDRLDKWIKALPE